jgi:HAD superfamily hydrolase (TIGR01509 family)
VCGGKERIRHYMQEQQPGKALPEDVDDYIADLHAAKTRFYVEMMAEGRAALRPGVERLIREAREAGLRLAIVTTTTPANVSALFRHAFGVHEDDWFEVVAAGGIVPQKKPAPDIYDYVLDRLQLPADRCFALEDSANGMNSALAAGVATLVTVNQYTDTHDFSGAAVVLDHLGEPDRPCHMLQGSLAPPGMVTVDYLRRLHAASQSAP